MKLNNIKDKLINMDKGAIIKKIKKVTIIRVTSVILLGSAGAYVGYRYIKSNENYTQADCQKIALKQIPGEIIKTKKHFNEDTLSLTYEFKIKGKDNLLNEIDVDSKRGAIIDIDHMDFNHNNRFYID